MTVTWWNNSAGGDWTNAGDWTAGVPTSSTDAVIGIGGGYTVTLLGESAAANSLTMDNAGVALDIDSSGGIASHLTIQDDFSADGESVEVKDGSTLTVGGVLNAFDLGIGGANLSAPTTVSASALQDTPGFGGIGNIGLIGDSASGTTNSATLDIAGAAPTVSFGIDIVDDADLLFRGGGITVITLGGHLQLEGAQARVSLGPSLTVGGILAVDLYGDGGTNLILGGVLTNTRDGEVEIGGLSGLTNNLSAPTTVIAAGLVNSGAIYLQGNTSAGSTNSATLDIIGAATDIGVIDVGANAVLSAGSLLVESGGYVDVTSGGIATGVVIGGGGVLNYFGPVADGSVVSYGAAAATLIINDLAGTPGGVQTQDFNAPLTGLIDGDRIWIGTLRLGNFTGIDAATPGTFNGTTTPLVLTSGGATVATLTLDGNYAGDAFGVSAPFGGGLVSVGMQINSPADFNGDGTGDVLFRNDQNGQLTFAAMNHGTFSSFGTATGGLGMLSAVGHGDVNGDGFSDVVVQDPSSGQVYFGLQNGSGNPTWVLGPTVPGFTVVGVGDIQGDDRADIVIQDAAGHIDYYDTKAGKLYDHERGGFVAYTPGWNVVGVGDVTGDGYADIVIQNPTTGEIDYINMTGGVFSGFVPVANSPGWNVRAVADLTGDGFDDIVVQNASSAAHVLYADMHGGVFSGWGTATTGLTPDYVVADTADVFNNGHADLIVQQQSTGITWYAQEGAAGFAGWGLVTTALASSYHVV